MEDPRSGLTLLIIVLSILLRINSAILIWTRRDKVPLTPSILLGLLSPVLCLATVSYAAGIGYSKDRISPLRGSVVLMGSLLLSQFITGMIFVGGLFLLGFAIPTGRALGPANDPGSLQAVHILLVVTISALLLFLMLLILKPEKDPISMFRGKKLLSTSLISILIMGPLLILIGLIGSALQDIGGFSSTTLIVEMDSIDDIVIMGIAIVVIAPFIEELLFRGYLHDQIRKGKGAAITVVLTSLLFSLVHFSIVALLPIFLMGLVMGWARERSGSILPSLLLHAGNNLVALMILSIQGYF